MSKHSFIVGDAGGTGAQWRVSTDGEVKEFQTIGFNAYTHNMEDLCDDILRTFNSEVEKDIPVYLYSAGVDTREQKVEVEKELERVFKRRPEVENDLVGTARALCGKESGNVCILGTGSNACYYNGETVNKVSASLGYVLGDEGSGAYLGKKLLMKVFRRQISEDVINDFQKEYELTSHLVIQRIYHKPRPNHFLASFAPFILERIDHKDIKQLVSEAFHDFFQAFFFKNEHADEACHFSGSVAWHFSDILRQVGEEAGFNIANVIKSPIDRLVDYHQKYG